MAKQKNNKSIGAIILYVLLLLVLIAVIGFIAHFTNNFTDDFKTFYVKSGNKVFATTDEYAITPNKTEEMSVGYTFGFLNNDNTPKGFSVKVLPNVTDETSFSYLVDGESYVYDTELDLSAAFNISSKEGSFSLTMPQNLQEALSKVYIGQAVEIQDNLDISTNSYFKLVVSSYNGKSDIVINLFYEIGVSEVDFDITEVVF